MTDWKQLTGFLVLPLFSLVHVLMLLTLSSVHREVQEDCHIFWKLKTSLKIVWDWETKSDLFLQDGNLLS